MQICRDADMQICTNFPGSKVTHTKWSYRSIWIRLLSKCAPEAIARPSGNLTNLIMGVFYTVRNIVFLLFPPWGSQPWLMKQINTLYIGCISWESVKNLNTTAQRFERSQTQKKHKNTKEHKNSNRVGCPNKLSFLSNVASNFLSPCFPHSFLFFQMHFLPTFSPPKCISLPTTSLFTTVKSDYGS